MASPSALSRTGTASLSDLGVIEEDGIHDFESLRRVLKKDIDVLLHRSQRHMDLKWDSWMARQDGLIDALLKNRCSGRTSMFSQPGFSASLNHKPPSFVRSYSQGSDFPGSDFLPRNSDDAATRSKSSCVADGGAISAERSIHVRVKSMWEEDQTRKMKAMEASQNFMALKSKDTLGRSNEQRGLVSSVVLSRHFETVMCCFILLNSISLGVEVEYTALMMKSKSPEVFVVIADLFISIFVLELALRFATFGTSFFCSSDAGWNIFDLLLVLVSVVDSLFAHVGHSLGQNLTIIRMIRVLRIVRVFRVFRLIRFFRSLRILIFSVFNTLKSLFWTVCLLTLILYFFGVIFTQATLQELYEAQKLDGESLEVLQKYYGSLHASCLTLFKTITGGVTWEEVLHPLGHMHLFYFCFFLVYVAFMTFAVLNVVTGIFCEAAIVEAQGEREEAVASHLESKSRLISRLQAIFGDLDTDNTGTVTIEEFERSLGDERLKAYFASLDLHVSEAWTLFKLLDVDGTHIIDLNEFVTGCLRLVGNAKSIDIAMLSYESRWMIERFAAFTQSIDLQLMRLREEMSSSNSKVKQSGSTKPASHREPPFVVKSVQV